MGKPAMIQICRDRYPALKIPADPRRVFGEEKGQDLLISLFKLQIKTRIHGYSYPALKNSQIWSGIPAFQNLGIQIQMIYRLTHVQP